MAAPGQRQTGNCWNTPLRSLVSEMVTNAVERGAGDPRCQTQAAQRGHTGGHEPFAAGLFSWKAAAFEQLDAHTTAAQLNRQRRTGDTSTGNQNIRHSLSRMRAPKRRWPAWPGRCIKTSQAKNAVCGPSQRDTQDWPAAPALRPPTAARESTRARLLPGSQSAKLYESRAAQPDR